MTGRRRARSVRSRPADNGHVNAVVIEVRRGKDSKLYPPRLPLPKAERNRLRWAAHDLICSRRMTYKAAQAAMMDEYGARRSIGQIWNDVHYFECPKCAP
jgi:hypothetical protein